MHFNVKNVLQLDEALHELPIHDSGITSIENEVGNKELLIHLSNLYENKKIELLFGCVDIFKTAISGDYDQGDDVITLYHERSKEAFKKIVKDNNISYRLIISEDELFEYELKVSITTAKAQNDKLWLQALKNLKKERKARDK